MLRKMSIGMKIASGFGILLTLLALLAVWSVLGVGQIVGNAGEVIEGNKLNGHLAQMEIDHLNWISNVNTLLTDSEITELSVQTDDHMCGFGTWLYGEERKKAETLIPSLAPILKSMEEPHHRLHASAININEAFQPADLELNDILNGAKISHLAWMNRITSTFLNEWADKLEDIQTDPHKCVFAEWLYSDAVLELMDSDRDFAAIWDKIEPTHRDLHESAAVIDGYLVNGDRDAAIQTCNFDTQIAADKTLGYIDDFIAWNDARIAGMQQANSIYARETTPLFIEVQELLGQARQEIRTNIMSDAEMLNAATRTRAVVIVVGIIATILGIALAFIVARGITKALKHVIVGLTSGSGAMASASGQVAQSSTQMAMTASEQASSLEEVSAALEEMASQTSMNADNASEASQEATNAQEAATNGREAMIRMNEAMKKIQASSGETAKIIGTINDIAFQTNLLALNAAVEAARAGESGKGFAVVAEEVRNLAHRSAEAARDTADLIEGAKVHSENGATVGREVDEILGQLLENVTSMGGLVGHVSTASSEQSTGIDEINRAVTQLDQLTQSNAANAEETASASEELSAQSQELNGMVDGLMQLVGGACSSESCQEAPAYAQKAKNDSHAPAKSMPAKKQAQPSSMNSKMGDLDPEDLLPLESEEELCQF